MLILGAATLSLWLILSAKTDSVFAEILSIIGWVFVWEATDIFVLQQASRFPQRHILPETPDKLRDPF